METHKMRRFRSFMFLIIITGILLVAHVDTVANGQLVGLVCITPASLTSCPAPPVTLSGTVGAQLTAAVLISGSDAFSGFDISLKTNHTILRPTGVSVSNSLLSGGTIVLECIGTSLKVGSQCGPTDTMDTLHLVLIGPAGFLTTAPSTGLLFTAIFNITSNSNTSLGYQSGCNPSSINGASTCVLLANGGLAGPQEAVQTAIYTQAPLPTFIVSSSQTDMTVSKGHTGNSSMSITSLNGFSGSVTFSSTFTPSTQHPPSLSFNPAMVSLTAGGMSSTLFTVSTKSNTSRASYSVIITATGNGVSQSFQIIVNVIV